MRHRSIKSRAGRVMLGAVLAGALSGAGANIARATLTLDLEAGSGNPNAISHSVTGVAAGTPVSIEVYAIVTGGAGTSGNDGLGAVFGSYDAAGSAATGMTFAVKSPFAYNLGTVASNGSPYSYSDSSSVGHVGVGPYSGTATGGPATVASANYNSTSPASWAFNAYIQNSGTSVSSIFTGGTALSDGTGAYYDLGTLTLNTSGSAANGSTIAVTGVGRTQQSGSELSALWTENGTIESPGVGSAVGADDSVTVSIGTTVTFAPADFNHDGSVDGQDFAVWQQDFTGSGSGHGPDTQPMGDANGDGFVDGQDFALWQQEFTGTLSHGSIISVPEPSVLSLAGLGLCAAFGRRRAR